MERARSAREERRLAEQQLLQRRGGADQHLAGPPHDLLVADEADHAVHVAHVQGDQALADRDGGVGRRGDERLTATTVHAEAVVLEHDPARGRVALDDEDAGRADHDVVEDAGCGRPGTGTPRNTVQSVGGQAVEHAVDRRVGFSGHDN